MADKMNTMKTLIALLITTVLAACGSAPPMQTVTLPNGQAVDVTHAKPLSQIPPR